MLVGSVMDGYKSKLDAEIDASAYFPKHFYRYNLMNTELIGVTDTIKRYRF